MTVEDLAESDGVAVLREDDPSAVALLADGWRVEVESWGARLTVADPAAVDVLTAAVHAVEATGWSVVHLLPQDASRIVALDRECLDDYPDDGRATLHEVPDERSLARDLAGAWSAYGALSGAGALDAVTVMRPDADRIETEFTVTRASRRRQGLASAVKAYGILDHVERGHHLFGTGGASRNTASVRANLGLGYVLEPRWLTLRRP
ncbi:acetyltransferase [Cellulomonas sp. P5_C5]